MAKQCLLSTVDNPFDPFEQFDEWFLFDVEMHHDCCAKLGRIAKVEEAMSDEEYWLEVDRAIDEIISNDPTNTYIRIVKDLPDEPEDDSE